jgi:hypothetical protein
MDDEMRQRFESLRRMQHDNRQLFESLISATEFTVTEDHLKLIRRIYVNGWDPGEYYGAASISSKKPYGNSYVTRDIAEILDAPDEDWEYEDGERVGVTDAAEKRFMRLHVETMAALQVVLAAGEFRPGRYRRTTTWDLDWQPDDGVR